MHRILVTNDDGVMSPAIRVLRNALVDLGEVTVVAPEGPRSATGSSQTFHKPLRVAKVVIHGMPAYSVSGNPADCVTIGLLKIMEDKPDVVVSGINIGDNTSVFDVWASGTVAGAVQGAIRGYPAVALSTVVPEEQEFAPEAFNVDLKKAAEIASDIVEWVLDEGLPEGVDFLNVNFPCGTREGTPIEVTKLARIPYEYIMYEREDPRGKPYYWQWFTKRKFEPGTDAHAVHVDRSISITPLTIDMFVPDRKAHFKSLIERFEQKKPG